MFFDNEINSNVRQHIKDTPKKKSQNLFGSKTSLSNLQNVLNLNLKSPNKNTELRKSNSNPTRGVMVDNALYNSEPPPLPPARSVSSTRNYRSGCC